MIGTISRKCHTDNNKFQGLLFARCITKVQHQQRFWMIHNNRYNKNNNHKMMMIVPVHELKNGFLTTIIRTRIITPTTVGVQQQQTTWCRSISMTRSLYQKQQEPPVPPPPVPPPPFETSTVPTTAVTTTTTTGATTTPTTTPTTSDVVTTTSTTPNTKEKKKMEWTKIKNKRTKRQQLSSTISTTKKLTTKDHIRNLYLYNITRNTSWFKENSKNDLFNIIDTAFDRAEYVRIKIFQFWNPDYGTTTRPRMNQQPNASSSSNTITLMNRPMKPTLLMDEKWWIYNILFGCTPGFLLILFCELYGKPKVNEYLQNTECKRIYKVLGNDFVLEYQYYVYNMSLEEIQEQQKKINEIERRKEIELKKQLQYEEEGHILYQYYHTWIENIRSFFIEFLIKNNVLVRTIDTQANDETTSTSTTASNNLNHNKAPTDQTQPVEMQQQQQQDEDTITSPHNSVHSSSSIPSDHNHNEYDPQIQYLIKRIEQLEHLFFQQQQKKSSSSTSSDDGQQLQQQHNDPKGIESSKSVERSIVMDISDLFIGSKNEDHHQYIEQSGIQDRNDENSIGRWIRQLEVGKLRKLNELKKQKENDAQQLYPMNVIKKQIKSMKQSIMEPIHESVQQVQTIVYETLGIHTTTIDNKKEKNGSTGTSSTNGKKNRDSMDDSSTSSDSTVIDIHPNVNENNKEIPKMEHQSTKFFHDNHHDATSSTSLEDNMRSQKNHHDNDNNTTIVSLSETNSSSVPLSSSSSSKPWYRRFF